MKVVQVSSLTLYDPDEETLRFIQGADVVKIAGPDSDVWRIKGWVSTLGPSPRHNRVVQIEVGGLVGLGSPVGPFECEIKVVDDKYCRESR